MSNTPPTDQTLKRIGDALEVIAVTMVLNQAVTGGLVHVDALELLERHGIDVDELRHLINGVDGDGS